MKAQEKEDLRVGIFRYLDDKVNDSSVEIAQQILVGNPKISNAKIRERIARERFERDLYEVSQVWHGKKAGEELASLTREELSHLLKVIPRTKFAMRKKARPFVAIHLKAMERRNTEIEACLQAHAEEGEKFRFTPEKGVQYYREICWNYDKLPTSFILDMYRAEDCFVWRNGLCVGFNNREVLAQMEKRSEIKRAKKGHYYDCRDYDKSEKDEEAEEAENEKKLYLAESLKEFIAKFGYPQPETDGAQQSE